MWNDKKKTSMDWCMLKQQMKHKYDRQQLATTTKKQASWFVKDAFDLAFLNICDLCFNLNLGQFGNSTTREQTMKMNLIVFRLNWHCYCPCKNCLLDYFGTFDASYLHRSYYFAVECSING